MKVLVVAVPFVIIFAIGIGIGRWSTPNETRRLKRDYNRMVQKLALADECLDDLSFMAADHAALNEPGGVLMGERIREYRKVSRDQK